MAARGLGIQRGRAHLPLQLTRKSEELPGRALLVPSENEFGVWFVCQKAASSKYSAKCLALLLEMKLANVFVRHFMQTELGPRTGEGAIARH